MFRLEALHGRSQVWAQWLNKEEAIQTAIDACPVSCIHWVQRDQLPALEHVMAQLPRVNVGIMAAGQGGAVADVFSSTVTFTRKREEAKMRAARTREARLREERRAAVESEGGWRAASKTEERNVGGMLRRWQAATGLVWDPEELRKEGRSVPAQRALVPVYAEEPQERRRRRLSAETLEQAHQAGLWL
jgi:hypothetical protein